MLNKAIKLFSVIYFSINIPCFSQSQVANDSLAINYNKWLKSVQLDKFLTAANVRDTTERVKGASVKIITLKPAASYSDPLLLAGAWDYLHQGFTKQGVDIYAVMLDKFAAYANKPIRQTGIYILSNNTDIFSVKIRFKASLICNEQIVLTKGNAAPIDYNFAAALSGMINGSYTLTDKVTDLTAYSHRLEKIFNNYKKNGQYVVIKRELCNKNLLRIKFSNVYGLIKGQKYYELVYLTVNLYKQNSGAEINYMLDVFYASGILKAPDDEAYYRDASIDFSRELLSFSGNFHADVKGIFYGKQ